MELNKETIDNVKSIEGFPIGQDEEIIKISNPPYYTACPNPFINEFIEKYGTPYDEKSDEYNKQPFTSDISEGKYDALYKIHSYPTKVPFKAILKYILHYTNPGDVIFDGFCGTGMSGVAAQMCDIKDNALAYELKQSLQGVEFGKRYAVLSDLSPLATFVSYNYNNSIDISSFQNETKKVINKIESKFGWLYKTNHVINGEKQSSINGEPLKGVINYTVWSRVYICPNCGESFTLWDSTIDYDMDDAIGTVVENFQCKACSVELDIRRAENCYITVYDDIINKSIRTIKEVPVLINYTFNGKRYEKIPDEEDFQLIEKIKEFRIDKFVPHDEIPFMHQTHQRNNLKALGIEYEHQIYTKRCLILLSELFDGSNDLLYRNKMQFLFALTASFNRITKLVRYMAQHKEKNVGPLSGTLYFPPIFGEINVFDIVKNKVGNIVSNYSQINYHNSNIISLQSTSNIDIKENSIDYIFIDPPFGDNLMYSELNYFSDMWLKIKENSTNEAIINKAQKKGLYEYQTLMNKCFEKMFKALKPNRWITVEFHNSQNSVWNSIQEAMLNAGFVIADVRTLDKKKGTIKQLTYTSAVKQDLIISAYKPKEAFIKRFFQEAGTEEGVWDFIREHLDKLPIVVENINRIDVVVERQAYLLYDRMLAFHIQKGATIPMGAADFYLGLKQRFPERDGMYFLPGQVSIYDTKRINQELNEQLSLIVMDEKTAIQWLHIELNVPKTYQDIQPKFLQELRQFKYEKMPELRDLLEENFLQDEHGKWYVPDVNKQSDLEKLRDKKLLKEFDEYRNSKGKLKVFRTEAIRAGFKHCWRDKDYKTIVNIGERMPEAVVQEDPSILMYYDNALTRIGD
jgi:DNA modification methylase